MLNLNNKKKRNLNLLQIRKKNSSVFNLTCNLKPETFDHGIFLYKVHELLLITLQLLSKNDFETILATFCCYDHGAKASEAVQKIGTDKKEYRKCSLCVMFAE